MSLSTGSCCVLILCLLSRTCGMVLACAEHVSVTQVTSGCVWGLGQARTWSQWVVRVRTQFWKEEMFSSWMWAALHLQLASGPILFGSIGIAIGVFNWSFVCLIFQFGAVHPLFCVSNAQCRHPRLRGWVWCYELASFSLTCWKYQLLWTENS